MNRLITGVSLVVVLFGVAFVAGCDEEEHVCDDLDQKSCYCPDNTTGYRTCMDNEWGNCGPCGQSCEDTGIITLDNSVSCTVKGFVPCDCVNSSYCDQTKDQGYEEDSCNVGARGACAGNVLFWMGNAPGDDNYELRWNHCPSYKTEDYQSKVCGWNPIDRMYDCVPAQCADLDMEDSPFFNIDNDCVGTYCSRCMMGSVDKPLIECDYAPSSYPDVGGFYDYTANSPQCL